MRARIVGTGSYVPEKVLTNQDLEEMVNTSDEWIMARTGIKERRITTNGEACSALATNAAENALEMAGISPEELDLIIVGTVTPDMFFPSVGCIMQDKLGAKKAAAFDVSAGCTGFIYALSIADSLMKSDAYQKALVIGTENLSKITDYQDRGTCVLLGDGAGAVVLVREEGKRGVISTHLHSDGSYGDLLYQPGGGTAVPPTYESIDNRLHYLKMDGNKLFKIAVKSLEDAVLETLAFNNIESSEIDLLIPHQANLRIIQAIAKRLNLPDEKVYVNIHKYGNTSSASIPIALDEANRTGRIKEDNLLIFDAFGAGLTWGAALVRW
ncbi:MAG: ketoacyl-ACP synthase III [Deltaproteobacteria bacterium]|nr:ketoacyl-ACP synthase III [Deltaproteobacteria bacterium]